VRGSFSRGRAYEKALSLLQSRTAHSGKVTLSIALGQFCYRQQRSTMASSAAPMQLHPSIS